MSSKYVLKESVSGECHTRSACLVREISLRVTSKLLVKSEGRWLGRQGLGQRRWGQKSRYLGSFQRKSLSTRPSRPQPHGQSSSWPRWPHPPGMSTGTCHGTHGPRGSRGWSLACLHTARSEHRCDVILTHSSPNTLTLLLWTITCFDCSASCHMQVMVLGRGFSWNYHVADLS